MLIYSPPQNDDLYRNLAVSHHRLRQTSCHDETYGGDMLPHIFLLRPEGTQLSGYNVTTVTLM